jgi:hypothetical protein
LAAPLTRLEKLCSEINQPLLLSESFATESGVPGERVGRYSLRGVLREVDVCKLHCTLYSSYRIRDFINAVSINSSLSSEPIGLAMMSLRTSKISAASEMLFSEAFTLRFQHIGR